MWNRRQVVVRGPLWALALVALATGMAGGCSGQPSTGTATEAPQVQKQREESIKDAMKRGAYGDKYKDKAAK
jgi:hypothetical protein